MENCTIAYHSLIHQPLSYDHYTTVDCMQTEYGCQQNMSMPCEHKWIRIKHLGCIVQTGSKNVSLDKKRFHSNSEMPL